MRTIGPYTVQGLLGRSSTAEVYRAVDTRSGRLLALKLLAAPVLDSAEARRRFEHEAQTLARLRNDHVLPLHDAGRLGGRPFVATPLVAGRSLRSLLQEQGSLALPVALSVVEQVAAALDAIHSAGVVHRDVKPDNVLLADDGHCWLVDFGLARSTSSSWATDPGVVVGSLAYTAPERFGARGDHRADVYALTCLLFELVTGRPPYVTSTAAALVSAHRSAPAPRAAGAHPGVGPALDDVVRRGLHKDPAARLGSAGELAAAARAAVDADARRERPWRPVPSPRAPLDPPLPAPPSPAGRTARAVNRASGIVLVATTVLAIALLLLFAAVLLGAAPP